MGKDSITHAVESRRDELIDVADRIWHAPELGLHEEAAAELLVETLRDAGFSVETDVSGMPTAFVGTYGSADPTVGIVGEYDALPGLSQEVTPERNPVEEGAPGHGCGHNLFAAASLGAAIGVKEAIEAGDLQGTVKYFGCPAEEILVGKVFMARAGVFDDVDAALTWHPNDTTHVLRKSSLALDSIRFRFDGTAAHAAASPESGRSALDAAQLLNTGVEYMREHIPDPVRVHYVTTEGGAAPNVVPSEAEAWYYVRAPKRSSVERTTDWLTDIAEGAAEMTQTEVTRRFITGCHQFRPNDVISEVVESNAVETAASDYTDADVELAGELQETLAPEDITSTVDELPGEHAADAERTSLYADHVPGNELGGLSGSTDVGDLSWHVPTAWLYATTYPLGTPAHSWQAVAANGSFGAKGAIYAAKVLGGAAYDLLDDPSTLESAWEEFDAGIGEGAYECPLPPEAEPPFDIHS